jgi:NDP-sugar pyrophosphorylase family protein
MNGDILTRLSPRALLEEHTKNGCSATMVVKTHEMQIPYGVVVSDEQNRILRIEEKPTQRFCINAGIYALSPQALARIPRNTFFDMPMLFHELVIAGERPTVYTLEDYWLDIGYVADYQRANAEFMHHFACEQAGSPLGGAE